jgi:ribonuclease BN (tRNA processing enzyme)
LEILFLGTGAGKASLKRDHSSILITNRNHRLLIDCGDGISKTLLKNKIDFSSIDSILISHFHPDHLDGISNLLNQMKMLGRKNNLRIYVHDDLIESLQIFLEISNIYLSRLGFTVQLTSFKGNDLVVLAKGFEFIAKKNTHLQKLSNELGTDDSKFISLSFLFSINRKTIFYSGDIGNANDLFLFERENIDYFITEVTHISLEELVAAYKNNNPGKIIITHIEDEAETALVNWHHILDETDKKKTIIAYDGLKMNIDNDR